jgi:hypothetical protein
MEPETREASLLQKINQNNNGLIFLAIAGVPGFFLLLLIFAYLLGAGKSTYSEKLCSRINNSLPDCAVVFPMDGTYYSFCSL